MNITKILLVLILLTTFICGCKKKTDSKIISEGALPVDYLSSSTYTKLKIDLVFDKGYPPSSETIDNIKTFLSARINKPDGIDISIKEVNGPLKPRMNISDISNAEKKNRTIYPNGNVLSTFIYLTNSEYEESQTDFKTLGVQYGAGSIVLFSKPIHNSSGGLGQPPYHILESSVALHEFGHVLGLVDAGTKMVTSHIDRDHGKHCNNNKCLMYFAVETSNIVANILGGSIPSLDANCGSDLRANGGR